MMMGVHDVFPPSDDNATDSPSMKNLLKLEGMWALVKDILGFTVDGIDKTIWLEAPKRDALLTILQGWIKSATQSKAGIPFDELQLVILKLRHAFISIPSGKGLLSPCNGILRLQPPFFICIKTRHYSRPSEIAAHFSRSQLSCQRRARN